MTQATTSLQQGIEDFWEINRLWRAGAVDRLAAMTRLSTIHDSSTHPQVRDRCLALASEIGGVKLPPKAIANG